MLVIAVSFSLAEIFVLITLRVARRVERAMEHRGGEGEADDRVASRARDARRDESVLTRTGSCDNMNAVLQDAIWDLLCRSVA